MKITLIHCYSDHNLGDTGIIYSIHDLAKMAKPDVDIRAMSVFSSKDIRFDTDHKHTRKIINNIYPCFYPEPGIQNIKNTKKVSSVYKIINFIKYLFVNFLIYLTKSKSVAKALLNKKEYIAFENFISSDKIISKGGSFLYSFKGVNGTLFFFRMIYPFYLAKRFGIDSYIYSQSIGPFENKSSRFLFNMIQPHIKKIYLRESHCLKYIKSKSDNIKIINDSAFSLNAPVPEKEKTDIYKVAITARPHDFKEKKQGDIYIESLLNLIDYLNEKKYEVYLVPQVTGPSKGEDDREILKVLYAKSKCKERLFYLSEDYDPRQIKSFYGEMDYLVGTRLHSTIFALGMDTPCINIAYHGTKSEGIMGALGLEDFVLDIETLTPNKLLHKFKELEIRKNEVEKIINIQIPKVELKLEQSMHDILS